MNVFEQIKVAKGIIELFQPDMNATVQLPRDFFKENPKRKKSEYPAETGYTALHLGRMSKQKRKEIRRHLIF